MSRFILAAVVLLLLAAQTFAAERPNFVFILVDDLAHDALGYAGRYEGLRTPHIDRLAAEGARFANAFVTLSLCSPSRASFLTGQYPHSHGVFTNQGQDLDPATPTFPQVLDKSGYATAFVGKWHMGTNPNPRPGFDYWLSFAGQGRYFDPPLNENGRDFNAQGYMTDLLADYAVKWLEGRKGSDEPFCLYLSHKAVHGPFSPAPRHKDALKDLQLKEPESFNEPNPPEWLRPAAAAGKGKGKKGGQIAFADRDDWNPRSGARIGYLEAIFAVDDSVGRVMQTLKSIGADSNTVVIFTSDNGFFMGEHGKGDKRLAYEESLRIPLIVRHPAPGVVKPGSVLEPMVLNIDVCPTILDLAGAEIPAAVQGRSFVPLLKGKTPDDWRDAFLYEYFYEDRYSIKSDIVAARTEDWKLVTYPDFGPQAVELYHLPADPHEMHNLVDNPAHRDKLAQMKQLLEQLKQKTEYRRDPER